MFNQKLHSLQTHQHIHSAVDKKRRRKCFSDVENVHTMHSTQLNAIIWLDADSHMQPSPIVLSIFSIVASSHTTYSKAFNTQQHQIYPSHLTFKYRGFMCKEFCTRIKIQNYNKILTEAGCYSKPIYAQKHAAEAAEEASGNKECL